MNLILSIGHVIIPLGNPGFFIDYSILNRFGVVEKLVREFYLLLPSGIQPGVHMSEDRTSGEIRYFVPDFFRDENSHLTGEEYRNPYYSRIPPLRTTLTNLPSYFGFRCYFPFIFSGSEFNEIVVGDNQQYWKLKVFRHLLAHAVEPVKIVAQKRLANNLDDETA